MQISAEVEILKAGQTEQILMPDIRLDATRVCFRPITLHRCISYDLIFETIIMMQSRCMHRHVIAIVCLLPMQKL